MKTLLITLGICLIAIIAQAQTPYIGVSASGTYSANDIAVGVSVDAFNFYYTASTNYPESRNYMGVGASYTQKLYQPSQIGFLSFFGQTWLIASADIKGMVFNHPKQNPGFDDSGIPVGFGLRGNVGFLFPVKSSSLTITTGYEKLFYNQNPSYYIPVTLGITF